MNMRDLRYESEYKGSCIMRETFLATFFCVLSDLYGCMPPGIWGQGGS